MHSSLRRTSAVWAMKRRAFLTQTCIGVSSALIPLLPFRQAAAAGSGRAPIATTGKPPDFPPIDTNHIDWSAILDPERFDVLFHEETEFAGSSPLNAEKRPGTYICAACLLPLFESRHKFESGTGWPSFTQPIDGRIATRTDFRMIVPRTEYHCARCKGHQGHVFKDGPPPRDERWCNNGLALQFVPEGQPLPALRT
jgi:peptide-methionine (R)-S-oxide reductase